MYLSRACCPDYEPLARFVATVCSHIARTLRTSYLAYSVWSFTFIAYQHLVTKFIINKSQNRAYLSLVFYPASRTLASLRIVRFIQIKLEGTAIVPSSFLRTLPYRMEQTLVGRKICHVFHTFYSRVSSIIISIKNDGKKKKEREKEKRKMNSLAWTILFFSLNLDCYLTK